MTAPVFLSEEIYPIKKLVDSFQDNRLLIKDVENEVKERKGASLSILALTLSATLLGNMLWFKGVIRASEETIKAGQDVWCRLILYLIWKYKSIIKSNFSLMILIQEIFYRR